MKIKVTTIAFSKNTVLRNKLEALFPEVEFNEAGKRFDQQGLINFLSNADGAIVGLDLINEYVLQCCPNLKVISKYGVGLDNIDLDACKRHNVKVGWTPGVNKTAVAELTIAFMLSLVRNIFLTSNQLKGGTWNKNGGFQLSEKTIGIIGVGNIGKEVIRLLQPFNCKILVNDIVDQDIYYKSVAATETDKETIFRESDIITIHTPLTDQTKFLVSESMLSQMKSNSIVINTARGDIVNLIDLKNALISNTIAGAALDVYEKEPPSDGELITLPNLICTPHIGGNSYEAVLAMGFSAIGHLKEFFK